MTFRVGQKVVCIDAVSCGRYMPIGFTAERSDMHGLTQGRVYTLRDLDIVEGVAVCRVHEIRRPICNYLREESFFAQARFRPVVEKKTDIGFAHEILRKVSRSKETVA